ncbi:MAG: hypothetical protein Q8K60_05105, partial [Parachlamydiaceae bacterium]|nr:hypothetical protein [Parachlamydiaceae bacterium]
NIGEESRKGTGELRNAYQILNEYKDHATMQFVGNVEAKDIFKGNVDVLITDGFTGNVLLKTSEGVASFILNKISQTLKNYPNELQSDIQSRLNAGLNFKEYSGAIICGVDRIIVKCHGQSTSEELFYGIMKAIKLVKNQFIASMKKEFESFL